MTAPQSRPPCAEPTSIAEVVDLVTAYAKQETVGPLRGASRWVARGAAGAACLGVGLTIVTLGVLRLVQTEWDRAAEGSLSWMSYLIAFLFPVALRVLAISRINRDTLNKEPQ